MIGFSEAFRHYIMSRIWPLSVAVLECKECRRKIDLEDAVISSPFSWPQMQTFWHECLGCGTGNHVRIVKGLSSIIEITGAPGPTWETLESCLTERLDMKEDPGFYKSGSELSTARSLPANEEAQQAESWQPLPAVQFR